MENIRINKACYWSMWFLKLFKNMNDIIHKLFMSRFISYTSMLSINPYIAKIYKHKHKSFLSLDGANI
jgi:hypothetical protein